MCLKKRFSRLFKGNNSIIEILIKHSIHAKLTQNKTQVNKKSCKLKSRFKFSRATHSLDTQTIVVFDSLYFDWNISVLLRMY